jgi:NTP pyrophosphatase (non-canonical NTP hydrolase)
VAAEIAQANQLGIPIEWMEYEEGSFSEGEEGQDIEVLIKRMLTFYAERDWNQFHSPKNLAMNLGVEVGELMEHFRWLTEAQSFVEAPEDLSKIQEEIGDVFLVLLHLSHTLGIDPFKAAHNKLTKTAIKYPVEKCKGPCHKYTEYEITS